MLDLAKSQKVNLEKLRKSVSKKIFIIEDSAHAFCGEYHNKVLGKFSDFAVFSFYATKSITCGEGGAIITNHKKYAEKIFAQIVKIYRTLGFWDIFPSRNTM